MSLPRRREQLRPIRAQIPCLPERGTAHRWRISEPAGLSLSPGQCVYCQKEQQFLNFIEAASNDWCLSHAES